MISLARLICGIFAVVAIVTFIGLLMIDHWFTIGERAQGDYPTRTPAEQAEAEARASAAAEEASKAADKALRITKGSDAEMKRDEAKKQ
ncbi:UNVERIFIED_ORG: hypothetical protein QE446_000968 [Rhizobium sp. SORGH_AS260]|uniref:hypothetical protein n=1 Tax=Agrobacterium TaxID=357 RepID=UPI001FCDEDB7|nr:MULTISPECIES: hypothetical protein [Agrobacterium]MCJ2876699.1 hypothetical protein [Agrobacterium pusense]MDP9730832.1 hypothetical protein [Rhizobium sp. SORGH_AS_0285]MDP9753111.1 hypothetical protein [Rhizobium sp. SORGH_AS_0260]MDR6080079.1 hypothetical protein [Agrobacterium sp. SORGH_AS_0440]